MIDILQILAGSRSIEAIGTGGTMFRTVNGFMGAAAIQAIRQYSFDRAFIGTTGIDLSGRCHYHFWSGGRPDQAGGTGKQPALICDYGTG